MAFIKEFRDFAIKGNLVDIAVAFVMGGAFGKVVSSLTEGIVSPLVGMLVGADLHGKAYIIKKGVPEVKDETGKMISKAIPDVAIKWGEFLTACINFVIVAFFMFLIIKAINNIRRKEEALPAPPSSTDVLLAEIRDSLKKQ